MTKRFCDTAIWNKNWFQELPIKQKLLTKFIFDACDCAGVYEISWKLLKFYFDEEITKEDFEKIKQVKFLNEDTIFIEDFVLFQCSIKALSELKPTNNAHKGIIKRLEKYNLLQAPNVPLTSPSLGAHSGAQEKEKEKEKEEEISSLVLSSLQEDQKVNPDFYFSDKKGKLFEIYKSECSDLIPLSFESKNRRVLDKANAYLKEINGDFEKFKTLCQKANKLKQIAKTKLDFEMIINNHIGIMNGKYETKNTPAKGVSQEFIDKFFDKKREEELKSG